jgi:hypothetical protein
MKNPQRCCSDTGNYPVAAKATDRFSHQMSNAKFDTDLWECVSPLYRQVAICDQVEPHVQMGDRSWYGPLGMVKWIPSRTFHVQKNEKCEITHTQPSSCCNKLRVESEKR